MFREFFNEIDNITGSLLEQNLIIDYQKPIIIDEGDKIVTWPNKNGLSYILKDISYLEKYKRLLEDRNYNFRLLDGSIFQFYYNIDRRDKKIITYRLAYYPNIFTIGLNVEDSPYDIDIFEHEIFTDYKNLESVRFPIRFDYDCDENKYQETLHTKSHLQFGEINNCRIPVNTPISPGHFINFIFMNFYWRIFDESFNKNLFTTGYHLKDQLTREEKRVLHLNIVN